MIWYEQRSQAIALRHAGLPGPAIEALTRAIALARPIPELTERVGTMLNYLADLYLSQGLLTEAEAAIREAIQYEGNSCDQITASNLMILAKVLHQQGRRDEAVRTGKKALRLFRKAVGWRHKLYRQYKQLVASFKKPPVPKRAEAEQVGRGAA